MLKNERQERILELIDEHRYVTAQQLSRLLYVSLPTVRRDLAELQQQGLILRNHGGAKKAEEGTVEIPLSFRNSYKQKEKKRLCRAAATLVKDGDTLFIDGSTTLLPMADCLADRHNLTVITNGIPLAMLLNNRHIRTYCTGGELQEASIAMAGRYAEELLAHFNVDTVFFSAYGINDRGYIVDTALPEMQLCCAAIHAAKQAVFVCDGGKFCRTAPHNILPLQQLDRLVTNTQPPKALHFPPARLLLTDE